MCSTCMDECEFAVNNKRYCVVFTCSFDSPSVWLYSTIDLAKDALRREYEAELRIAKDENGWIIVDAHIQDDGMHAVIKNPDDHMEFFVSEVFFTIIKVRFDWRVYYDYQRKNQNRAGDWRSRTGL